MNQMQQTALTTAVELPDGCELARIAQQVLELAGKLGASSAEADISVGTGQNVTVRRGEVETIEYNRDKGFSVTVYFGKQRGHASSSDLSAVAIRDTVAAACDIARFTAKDEFSGLADADLLARGELPDLDLHHPWGLAIEPSIELAKRTEAAAFDADPRVSNSEGASVSSHESNFVYANSQGFLNGFATTRHSISCSVIANHGDAMQRDYWYTAARDPSELESPEHVGSTAGQRAAARLDARRVRTVEVPVLFDPTQAAGLIGHFVGAVSGGSLYRRASFLLDHLGQQVFSPVVQLREEPHLSKALASSMFDDEGVATQARNVVHAGRLEGYFLGSYSGRKLGMKTTANAGGNHNLILAPGEHDFNGLLKMMGSGLLVTELLGQGINLVTGDYSRGAAGFWVEGGEIAYPVEEITIAGNLRDMFRVWIATDRPDDGCRRVASTHGASAWNSTTTTPAIT